LSYPHPNRVAGRVPPGAIRLRPEREEDEPLLSELFASTREEELALTGWDAGTRAAFLDQQFKAMRRGYRDMFPKGRFSIITVEEVPVGRLVVNRAPSEIHLVDIVISAAWRNRGIGGSIMQELLAEARSAGVPITLQVFKGSRADNFYRRYGFSLARETEMYIEMEWKP
jgi:GNAT superfamily N-acetyltransferase